MSTLEDNRVGFDLSDQGFEEEYNAVLEYLDGLNAEEQEKFMDLFRFTYGGDMLRSKTSQEKMDSLLEFTFPAFRENVKNNNVFALRAIQAIIPLDKDGETQMDAESRRAGRVALFFHNVNAVPNIPTATQGENEYPMSTPV